MKTIGAHVSIAKGIETIQEQMDLLKCETCAIFLANQKKFDNPPIPKEKIEKFKNMVKNKEVILPHGPYVINLANPEKISRHFETFIQDLTRCHDLGIRLYNLHPGSDTTGMGKEKTASFIAENINKAMKIIPDVIICVENMAGQGNCYGRTFEELKMLIDHIEDKSRIGITLDTCHMFVGGYDIRKAESFEKIMQDFDRIVGLKYLKAMHLNDSMTEFNSRSDRHESLGKGKIGLEAFEYIMQSPYFDNIPMVLETPRPELYKEEIALLKSFEN